MKKLSVAEVKRRLLEKHGNTLTLNESTYVSARLKALFIDRDFGKWWAAPQYVIGSSATHCHPKRGYLNLSKINKFNEDRVKEKIKRAHKNIVSIDYATYKNSNNKALFFDSKYGRFWAKPGDVFNGHGHPVRGSIKRELTMLKRYGVKNISQNREFALKASKSMNNSGTIIHWKTSEECVWRASYEKAVLEHLNKNKINFSWQIPFKMPNDKIYFIDLHLTGTNTWVEIKGYFRKDAKAKWDWFRRTYPNSELWDANELKRMNLI